MRKSKQVAICIIQKAIIKLYAGSNRNNGNSQYSLEKKKFMKITSAFLISAQKDHLIDKFGGTMTFGGNSGKKTTSLKGDATKQFQTCLTC